MGKIIGRGMPNILLFTYISKVSLYGSRRDLSFTQINFDIIIMPFRFQHDVSIASYFSP